jgi:hypothetical protein
MARYKRTRCKLLEKKVPGEEDVMLGVIMVALPLGYLFTSALADQPTVVELFTSEGCSASPSADALLSELAGRPDVLALSYHVTYWDRMGWADPFATEGNTQRQRDYNEALRRDSVYTPQMIVNGRREVSGHRPRAVGEALAASRDAKAVRRLKIGMEARDGTIEIDIPRGHAGREARVLLVRYELRRAKSVKGGENRGQHLRHANVVREITDMGPWNGSARALQVPMTPAGYGIAVLVQEFDAAGRPAAILGAARVERRLLGGGVSGVSPWGAPWEAMVRMMRAAARRRTGGDGAAPL